MTDRPTGVRHECCVPGCGHAYWDANGTPPDRPTDDIAIDLPARLLHLAADMADVFGWDEASADLTAAAARIRGLEAENASLLNIISERDNTIASEREAQAARIWELEAAVKGVWGDDVCLASERDDALARILELEAENAQLRRNTDDLIRTGNDLRIQRDRLTTLGNALADAADRPSKDWLMGYLTGSALTATVFLVMLVLTFFLTAIEGWLR